MDLVFHGGSDEVLSSFMELDSTFARIRSNCLSVTRRVQTPKRIHTAIWQPPEEADTLTPHLGWAN